MLGGVLSLDGQPIAVLVCALDSQRGVCYTLKTGIRQNLSSARLSLGALVMDRLLAALWAKSDVRLIDFVSKQSYTERWANEVLSFERRVAFASSWRGQAAALLDRAFQHAVAQRERIVETTGR